MRDDLPWALWSRDTFDRGARPLVDRRGVGLEEGLAALWRSALREGVRDSGSPSFTRFELRWTTPDGPERSASVAVHYSENPALARLRGWVYGRPGPGEARGRQRPSGGAPLREGATLAALARSHRTGLARSGDASAGILATIAAAEDLDGLLAALAGDV